jgi:quercetin dioxygenase-like cupin family protein
MSIIFCHQFIVASKERSVANPGDEIQSKDGEKLIFHQTAAATGGALLEMEVTYVPNSSRPPAHYHPGQEEHFRVVSGAMSTWIDGEERVYHPGETFTVPPGTPHAMHNDSDEEGRVVWEVRPALNTETFLKTMWGLAEHGLTDRNGMPSLLQIAVLFRAYNREFRLLKPSYPIQRILFGILAILGRLRGYKSTYPGVSGTR